MEESASPGPASNSSPPTENDRRKPALRWVLALVFALAMLMGTGPGLLLVNKPVSFLGLPLLYAWGLFWYAVQVVVIVTAYVALWREDEEQP